MLQRFSIDALPKTNTFPWGLGVGAGVGVGIGARVGSVVGKEVLEDDERGGTGNGVFSDKL